MMTAILRALVAVSLTLTSLVPGITTATTPDRDPVYVETVEVLYLESFPVQVQLRVVASVPTPCHEPSFAVSDDGTFIRVELWSQADPEAVCADVLEPVDLVIPIGEYEQAERVVLVDAKPMARVQVGIPFPDAPQLLGAGWSFGFCAGYCRADLVVLGEQLLLTGGDHWAVTPLYTNRGTLTGAGLSRLTASLEGVDPAQLEPVYGCPDCADGGAAYLSLGAAGQHTDHQLPFGDPPPELADAYALAQSLMSALETCSSSELVVVSADCSPYPTD